jgi:hypothetical protein
MKKNNSLILGEEFIQYCKINNIEDPVKYGNEVFEKGFNLVKYGSAPPVKGVTIKEILETPVYIPFIPLIETPPIQEEVKEEEVVMVTQQIKMEGVVTPDKKIEIKSKDIYGD